MTLPTSSTATYFCKIYLAGIFVDLDHRDVGAEGPSEVLWIEYADCLESWLGPFRQALVPVGGQSDLLEGLGVGRSALYEVLSVLCDNVLRSGLQQVGRDALGLVLDLVDAHVDGVAATDRATGAESAGAHLHLVGVAVNDFNVLDRNPQLGRGQLRECRVVSLSMPGRPGEHGHLAGRVDPHQRALPDARARAESIGDRGRRHPADLDVCGQSNAQVTTIVSGRGLFGPEVVVADEIQRTVERGFIVSAVVDHGRRDLMTVFKRRDEVLSPDLGGVHSDLSGETVHHPLHQVCGLGATGASVCVHRGGGRENAGDFALNVVDAVRTTQHQAEQVRRYCRGECGQVGAHVGVHVGPETGDVAIAVPDDLDFAHMVAPVRRG